MKKFQSRTWLTLTLELLSISQSFLSSISPISISQSFLGLFRKVIPSDSTLHFSKFSISQTEDILQVLLFRQVLRREKPVCKIVKLAKSKTCKTSSVCEIGSTRYFVTYVSIKSHRENHRLFFGKLILSLLSKNFNFDSLITHTLINTISWPEVKVLFRQFTTPQIYQHWATDHIVVVNISPVQQQSSTEQEIILNRNSSSLTLLISVIVPRILNALSVKRAEE